MPTRPRADYSCPGWTIVGIAAGRVELVGLATKRGHALGAVRTSVDIALDPFPYNGTTTTCEALWMGVPVVTLRGDRHGGRVGASLLSQIGLTDLIANSVEEYLEIAVALARNPERLSDLRRTFCARAWQRRHCATGPLSLAKWKPRFARCGAPPPAGSLYP